MRSKLSILQVYMTLILAIGLVNHVTMIPLLLQVAGKDAWISVLFALPVGLLFCFIPASLSKKSQPKELLGLVRSQAPKAFSVPVIGVLCIYMFINALITAKETILWTKVAYLPQTPMLVTSLMLLSLCTAAALAGIRPIVVCSGILLPFVWLLGYFVMSANFQFKRYQLLFPLFTTGVSSVMTCMLYVCSCFIEVFVLCLLQHHLRSPIRWWHFALLVFILIGLTVGPLMGALAAFGQEAIRLRYPAFEQWRLVIIGEYIAHVDFLSIYQWLSGSFIRIALALFLIAEMMPLRSAKQKRAAIVSAGVLQFAMLLVPFSDMKLLAFIRAYFPVSCLAVVALLLLLLIWVHIRGKERGESM